MLHCIVGSDSERVREEASKIIAETTGFEIVRLRDSDISAGMLIECANSDSLFYGGFVYVLSVNSKQDSFDDVRRVVSDMAESPHMFVCMIDALNAGDKKVFSSHAKSFNEYNKKTETYDVFQLASILARKDRYALWLGIHDAYARGVPAEAIIGILLWKLRDMYTSKRNGAFTPQELRSLSRSLIRAYHEGHSGGIDINAGLEKWVLDIA